MARYRKKPVEIEAWRVCTLLADASHDWSALPVCVREEYDAGRLLFLSDSIDVITLEGVMKASFSDVLIRGVKGEIYPCKPDIFLATYDPA